METDGGIEQPNMANVAELSTAMQGVVLRACRLSTYEHTIEYVEKCDLWNVYDKS